MSAIMKDFGRNVAVGYGMIGLLLAWLWSFVGAPMAWNLFMVVGWLPWRLAPETTEALLVTMGFGWIIR